MATDQEKDVSATVDQPTYARVEEEAKPGEKPVKEKKTKAPKEKKPKQSKSKAASHPPYFQMIKEALLALKDKSGSSPYAIAKYIEEKHKAFLPANFKKILGLQLKNSAVRGKLVKIRASYKLTESGKRDQGTVKIAKAAKEEKKVKRPSTRTSTRKTRSMNKTEKPTKKVGVKKAKKTSVAKPKQPKSIKSSAAKRTKRAAVTASAS